MEDVAFQYGDIEKIIDFESVTEIPQVSLNMEVDAVMQDLQAVSIVDNNKKYKKYVPKKIRQFIQIMQDEGTTVQKVAACCMIPRETAYRLIKEFNSSNCTVLPGSAPKGQKRRYKTKIVPSANEIFDRVPW